MIKLGECMITCLKVIVLEKKDYDKQAEMCNRISLDYDYVIDYAIDCQL
jgi:hypothetical protein